MQKVVDRPTKTKTKAQDQRAPATLAEHIDGPSVTMKDVERLQGAEPSIRAPNYMIMHLPVKNRPGSPLVINAFSAKARETMRQTQEAGSVGKKNKTRQPKDFNEVYQSARHLSTDGWDGVSANAFRSAAIDACRLCGFHMTVGRRALMVEPDGVDAADGTPLVRIHGTPQPFESMVRVGMGVADIRMRPRFDEWTAVIRLRFDADLFSPDDVLNLMWRAGEQCGVGEGRPSSKISFGQGWGLFEIDPSQGLHCVRVARQRIEFKFSDEVDA